jgi:hypothetical protein
VKSSAGGASSEFGCGASAEALARRALKFVPVRTEAIRAPMRGRVPLVRDFRFRPAEAAHSKREQNLILGRSLQLMPR